MTTQNNNAKDKEAPERWSGLETSNMKSIGCSLLAPVDGEAQARTISGAATRVTPTIVLPGFEAVCMEIDADTKGMLPFSMVVAGKCNFVSTDIKKFKKDKRMLTNKKVRKKGQPDVHTLDWPNFHKSLMQCPLCCRTVSESDDGSQFWMVWHSLLQLDGKRLEHFPTPRLMCVPCFDSLWEPKKMKIGLPLRISHIDACPGLPLGRASGPISTSWSLYDFWYNTGLLRALELKTRESIVRDLNQLPINKKEPTKMSDPQAGIPCAICEKNEGTNLACGNCGSVSYCCKEHQRTDWARHKGFCNIKRK